MDAFLDELSRDPAARRKRVLLAAGALALLATTIGITTFATSSDETVCTGAAQKLETVWSKARKDQVLAAFLATKKSFAQSAFDAIAKRLNERGARWTALRTDACEATQKRRDQPESVMVLRMACFDQKLREVGQLVDVFAAADGVVVERAVGATGALSPLDECSDVARLTSEIEPPKDAAVRARVDELRVAIGKAKVLTDAGKYKDAHAVAKQAADDARKLAYRPVIAEALVQLGELESYLGDREKSTVTLREAIRIADVTRNDAARARGLTWLTGVVGYDLEKTAEGLVLADDSRAAFERYGGDPRLEATLESNLGRIYSVTGDYEKMYEHHHNALELRRKVYGEDDPATANSQNNVAAALHDLGRITEALAAHEKALAMREKALGKEHPNVAMSLSNIGSQYYELGRLEEAVEVTERALVIARRSLPTKAALILIALGNRGSQLGELGRFDEAKATFDELITTLRADQPKSLRMARALANQSMKLLTPSGKMHEGLLAAEEALALIPKDAKNDEMAMALIAKGEALLALARIDEAAAPFRASLEIYEKTVGKDKPASLDSLIGLAIIARVQKRPAEAVDLLSRALAICEKASLSGKWLAMIRFELARALVETDKARAISLAEQARTYFAAVPTLERDLAIVDGFIKVLR